MREYAAHAVTDVTEASADQLDGLVDALAGLSAAAGFHGGRLEVWGTVVASNLAEANRAALEALASEPVRAALGRAVRVLGVEVLEDEEFQRRLDAPAAEAS